MHKSNKPTYNGRKHITMKMLNVTKQVLAYLKNQNPKTAS